MQKCVKFISVNLSRYHTKFLRFGYGFIYDLIMVSRTKPNPEFHSKYWNQIIGRNTNSRDFSLSSRSKFSFRWPSTIEKWRYHLASLVKGLHSQNFDFKKCLVNSKMSEKNASPFWPEYSSVNFDLFLKSYASSCTDTKQLGRSLVTKCV